MLNLGVNIDHVATLRQARQAPYPNVVEAAKLCMLAGAQGITAHLREDRRHINDDDIANLRRSVEHLNMEMAVTEEMVKIAADIVPDSCCLVPEKRRELTTEGGLDMTANLSKVAEATNVLHGKGIKVSVFIDPVPAQIALAKEANADSVELHTGSYSNASGAEQVEELDRLIAAADFAHEVGLKVNAGHGLDYENLLGVYKIPHLCELNIGFAIIARAIFTGLENAVREMRTLMNAYNLK